MTGNPIPKALMLAAACLLAAAAPGPQSYRLDASASDLKARVSFLGIGSKSASFPQVEGTVQLDRARPRDMTLDVRIDARKLTATDDLTQARLKGEKFFWVEKYPKVRFVGDSLSLSSATKGTVAGRLTARGVTRPVTLEVSFERPPSQAASGDAIALSGKTRIDRTAFGMDAYRLIVGKSVDIELKARLVPR